MRPVSIFGESFLDGLTMGGFLRRLRRPGAATRMFAPEAVEESPEWDGVVFEPASGSAGMVRVAGSLKVIPGPASRAMVEMLQREDEERKMAREASGGAAHGTSR